MAGTAAAGVDSCVGFVMPPVLELTLALAPLAAVGEAWAVSIPAVVH